MGYMRHHGLLITSFKEEHAEAARQQAENLGLSCSPLAQSASNGYHSFAVFPDGSKEGWSESDKGDEARRLFRKWLHRMRYSDGSTSLTWVEVLYGDDEGECSIVDHDGTIRSGDDYDGPHDLDDETGATR